MMTFSLTYHRPRPTLVVATASLLALTVLSGCSGEAAEGAMPPPPRVSVAEVPVKAIRQWDELSGRIEAVERVELRPRISGYIEHWTAQPFVDTRRP